MGVTAKHIGRKAVRAANSTVNFAVLVVLLLLVAFGSYALWDSNQVYNAANAAQYEIYKPSIEDEGKSFGELKALNPEVFSWLTVYGTNIDYPVTQGETNMKYVNTNAEGNYALSGSIFLDCDNQKDFSDFNSIIYGHHMEKQTMFGEIGLFAEQSYFDARAYGNLYYDGKDHGLEFFAFLHTDAYDATVFAPGIQGREAQQQYLDNLLKKAVFTRDIGVTADDRIVLLGTCSEGSTNGRDILVARITDTLYTDTFKPKERNNTGTQKSVDAQRLWTNIPGWLWIGLAALVLLLIPVIVFYYRKQKQGHLLKDGRFEKENKQKE